MLQLEKNHIYQTALGQKVFLKSLEFDREEGPASQRGFALACICLDIKLWDEQS